MAQTALRKEVELDVGKVLFDEQAPRLSEEVVQLLAAPNYPTGTMTASPPTVSSSSVMAISNAGWAASPRSLGPIIRDGAGL